MEPVDFTQKNKRQARDHAGWAASMFRDIKLAEETAITIGLVRTDPQDVENENTSSGLALLRMDANVIVDWSDEQNRQQFLNDRKRFAECSIHIKNNVICSLRLVFFLTLLRFFFSFFPPFLAPTAALGPLTSRTLSIPPGSFPEPIDVSASQICFFLSVLFSIRFFSDQKVVSLLSV